MQARFLAGPRCSPMALCCSHTLQPSTMAFAKCFRHPCKAAPRCTREPQPCPAHARRTFCMSDPSPGQCDSPARSGACPPCPVEVRKPRPCIVASVKSRSPGPSENGAEMHGWCQDPTSWPHSARDQNNTVAVSAATVGLGCACCRDADGRPLLRTGVHGRTRSLRPAPAPCPRRIRK